MGIMYVPMRFGRTDEDWPSAILESSNINVTLLLYTIAALTSYICLFNVLHVCIVDIVDMYSTSHE